MKLLIVAVGLRVPDWAQTAWDDYAKRFPPELRVELKAVKTEPRASKSLETLYAAERERIEAAIPKGSRIVVLDERGTTLTSVALAARLKSWQLEGDNVALVIGGPDGLDPVFKQARKHVRLTWTRHFSVTRKAVILVAIAGIVLYAVLFSTTPAVHDFFHELRHHLMIIPCH